MKTHEQPLFHRDWRRHQSSQRHNYEQSLMNTSFSQRSVASSALPNVQSRTSIMNIVTNIHHEQPLFSGKHSNNRMTPFHVQHAQPLFMNNPFSCTTSFDEQPLFMHNPLSYTTSLRRNPLDALFIQDSRPINNSC